MNPKITIVAEGEDIDEAATQSILETISELTIRKVGQERGVIDAAGKAIMWVAEIAGGTSKIVDALLKVAENQLAGTSLKVKYGNTEIEISNMKRSQLMQALDKAQQVAQAAANL